MINKINAFFNALLSADESSVENQLSVEIACGFTLASAFFIGPKSQSKKIFRNIKASINKQ